MARSNAHNKSAQLNQLYQQAQQKVGINFQNTYGGDVPAKVCGAVGGNMVRTVFDQLKGTQGQGGR